MVRTRLNNIFIFLLYLISTSDAYASGMGGLFLVIVIPPFLYLIVLIVTLIYLTVKYRPIRKKFIFWYLLSTIILFPLLFVALLYLLKPTLLGVQYNVLWFFAIVMPIPIWIFIASRMDGGLNNCSVDDKKII